MAETTLTNDEQATLAAARRIERMQMLERHRAELREREDRAARAARRREAAWAVMEDRAIEYGGAVLLARGVLINGMEEAAIRLARAVEQQRRAADALDLQQRIVAHAEEKLAEGATDA